MGNELRAERSELKKPSERGPEHPHLDAILARTNSAKGAVEVDGILTLREGQKTDLIGASDLARRTTPPTIAEAGRDRVNVQEETDGLKTTVERKGETATRDLVLPHTAVSGLDQEVKPFLQQ